MDIEVYSKKLPSCYFLKKEAKGRKANSIKAFPNSLKILLKHLFESVLSQRGPKSRLSKQHLNQDRKKGGGWGWRWGGGWGLCGWKQHIFIWPTMEQVVPWWGSHLGIGWMPHGEVWTEEEEEEEAVVILAALFGSSRSWANSGMFSSPSPFTCFTVFLSYCEPSYL